MSGVGEPLAELAATVRAAAAAVNGGGGELSAQLKVERPKREGQGDYSTNAAMLLAPGLGVAPRAIAERIGAELHALLGEDLERVEVAGPGFLNLMLTDRWHRRALESVLAAGERFGSGAARTAERTLI